MANTKITTSVIADGAITSAKLDTDISVSGSITGTLATAAQPNITSVGTLTGLDVAGTPTFDGLTVASDTNITATIGTAKIGYIGFDDFAGFAHIDNATGGNSYALLQYNTGETYLNAASGRALNFRINNSNVGMFTSDGNLLVGNTDSTPYDRTSGNAIALGDGLISSAQEGGNAAIFNRMTSDGSVVGFRKNGTSIGQIGAYLGSAYIQGNSVSSGLLFGNSNVYPWDAGALSDGNIELGNASYRWNNIYLSGGAYLGGTGSANRLDDYEEGTFTATLQNTGTSPALTANGSYTKIGRQVTIHIYFAGGTIASAGNCRITGLPFSASAINSSYGMVYYTHGNVVSDNKGSGYISGTAIDIIAEGSTGYAQWNTGSKYGMWTGIYQTA